MFDKSTSVNTENCNFVPMIKTSPESFFVYALKDRSIGYGSWTEEFQKKVDEQNKYEREQKDAVSLNDLLGSHPHIEGEKVEVLQIMLLNRYGTEAMVEVRYL